MFYERRKKCLLGLNWRNIRKFLFVFRVSTYYIIGESNIFLAIVTEAYISVFLRIIATHLYELVKSTTPVEEVGKLVFS